MSDLEVAAKTLPELKRAIDRLASRIEAPTELLPTYDRPRGDGLPCLEHDSRGFHYVISERGYEHTRVTSRDAMEILYLVFQSTTSEMVFSWELANRIPGQDSRRLAFERQCDLLGQLSDGWATRCRREHEQILKEYPFDDESSARVELTVSLQRNGLSDEEAWRKACERYPLPEPAEPDES